MLLAAWLAAMTLPNMAPQRNNTKNLPAKVKAPKGPKGKYSRSAFGACRPLLSATTRAQSKAAMNMFTPRNAIKINKAKPTNNPAFPSMCNSPLFLYLSDRLQEPQRLACPRRPGSAEIPFTQAQRAALYSPIKPRESSLDRPFAERAWIPACDKRSNRTPWPNSMGSRCRTYETRGPGGLCRAAFYSSKLCDTAETTKTVCFSYKAAQLTAVSLAKMKKNMLRLHRLHLLTKSYG